MNPVLDGVPRAHRRELLRKETKNRARGDWGPWTHEPVNGATGSTGWGREFHTVHYNAVFSVLERTLPTGHTHLMVTSLTQVRPTWYEMQRIKNELAGEGATGVEVYPPETEIVDGADAYHLWILPEPLPFSLFERRTS